MQSEPTIRNELVKALERQIENVKKDDEAGYLINGARINTLAEVLELNLYAKSVIKNN